MIPKSRIVALLIAIKQDKSCAACYRAEAAVLLSELQDAGTTEAIETALALSALPARTDPKPETGNEGA